MAHIDRVLHNFYSGLQDSMLEDYHKESLHADNNILVNNFRQLDSILVDFHKQTFLLDSKLLEANRTPHLDSTIFHIAWIHCHSFGPLKSQHNPQSKILLGSRLSDAPLRITTKKRTCVVFFTNKK